MTKQVDADEISGLLQRAEQVVDPAEKQTREMDPATFRALLRDERGNAPTPPMPEPVLRTPASTAELMARVDDAFAEDAAPAEPLVITESRPVKKPALIVADHRLETRHAAAIPPITKPPLDVPAPLPAEPWLALAMTPPVEAPRAPLSVPLIVALGLAIAVAVVIVLIS